MATPLTAQGIPMPTHAHTPSPPSHPHLLPLGARHRPQEALDPATMRARLEALLEAAQGGLLAKFDLVSYEDTYIIQAIEALLERPGVFQGSDWGLPGTTIVVGLELDQLCELEATVFVWAQDETRRERMILDTQLNPVRLHSLIRHCAALRREGKMGLLPPLHVSLSAELVDYFLRGEATP